MDLREGRVNDDRDDDARHPWERARLAVVRALIGDHADTRRIIDLGAGDGYQARALANDGYDVTAVDPAFTNDDIASLQHRRVAARTSPPAPADSADVLLLDVIEHVDDDSQLLVNARALARGGVVIVTVPAWPALWSAHDEALGHRRRYTPSSLAHACAKAGLVVVEEGALFACLTPARALALLRARLDTRQGPSRRAPAVASWRAPSMIGALITRALVVDAFVGRALARAGFGALWPGLSLYAVCRSTP